jgi:hypothetical protein
MFKVQEKCGFSDAGSSVAADALAMRRVSVANRTCEMDLRHVTV